MAVLLSRPSLLLLLCRRVGKWRPRDGATAGVGGVEEVAVGARAGTTRRGGGMAWINSGTGNVAFKNEIKFWIFFVFNFYHRNILNENCFKL